MSSQWINRIFEVDPTFVSSKERDEFGSTGGAASTVRPMKASLRAPEQVPREDPDPMTVLRVGLDEHLASGTNDLGLFQRLRASLDNPSGESARPAQAGR
jgi:hypothetical protein